MTRLATRLDGIASFHVMDVLARARALEAQGRSIIHLEIGEPDFPTDARIVQAGIDALGAGATHYLPALGLPTLRQAIADRYPAAHRPDPGRVVVTPGGSGALLLACAALINPGDRVLMTDPGYPCNRHFVRLFGGEAVPIAVDATTNYQLTPEHIRAHWDARTVAVLIGSPANPTGTMLAPDALAELVRAVELRGGIAIVDEIYHGLTYDIDAVSALAYSERVVVINSFSKYFGMTGWRVGWMVAPPDVVPALDRLAQNVFLSTNTPAQYAALRALDADVRVELERRRAEFKRRRDYLVPALGTLGFDVPLTPQGAFYVYANCRALGLESERFARELLEQSGVALTPGLDFGAQQAAEHVRVSYANTIERLQDAVQRIDAFLARGNL
ncbi:MAG: aminotransferase class I/II-fold pyridoxal phosphate-dependent enzyme [Gammaproteobacteria bacterium]